MWTSQDYLGGRKQWTKQFPWALAYIFWVLFRIMRSRKMRNVGRVRNLWKSEINRKLIISILNINQYIPMIIHWTFSKLENSFLDFHPWATAICSELDNKRILLPPELEHSRIFIGFVRHFYLYWGIFATVFFSCHREISGPDFMFELYSTPALNFNRNLLVRIKSTFSRNTIHYSFCLLFTRLMGYLNNLHPVYILW